MLGPTRIRRVAKWTGVAVCGVLVMAWIGTGRWLLCYNYVRRDGTGVSVQLGHGAVALVRTDASGHFPLGVVRFRDRYWHTLWLPDRRSVGRSIHLVCPMWMLLLPVTIPTAYLFYRDRRPPRGHCQGCGYNLTGNVTGVCPECGCAVSS